MQNSKTLKYISWSEGDYDFTIRISRLSSGQIVKHKIKYRKDGGDPLSVIRI